MEWDLRPGGERRAGGGRAANAAGRGVGRGRTRVGGLAGSVRERLGRHRQIEQQPPKVVAAADRVEVPVRLHVLGPGLVAEEAPGVGPAEEFDGSGGEPLLRPGVFDPG